MPAPAQDDPLGQVAIWVRLNYLSAHRPLEDKAWLREQEGLFCSPGVQVVPRVEEGLRSLFVLAQRRQGLFPGLGSDSPDEALRAILASPDGDYPRLKRDLCRDIQGKLQPPSSGDGPSRLFLQSEPGFELRLYDGGAMEPLYSSRESAVGVVVPGLVLKGLYRAESGGSRFLFKFDDAFIGLLENEYEGRPNITRQNLCIKPSNLWRAIQRRHLSPRSR